MAAVKTKAQAQICAVVGSDESEVKRVARARADELTPAGGGDFACDIIDGVADNADAAAGRIHQAIEALLTFPFFGGEKLVWLKSATFLADDPTGRAQAVTDALEKLAETLGGGLPGSTRFLLSAIGVDERLGGGRRGNRGALRPRARVADECRCAGALYPLHGR